MTAERERLLARLEEILGDVSKCLYSYEASYTDPLKPQALFDEASSLVAHLKVLDSNSSGGSAKP